MKKNRMLFASLILSSLLCFSISGFASEASIDDQLASIGLAMSAQEFVFDVGDSGICIVSDPEILTVTYGLIVSQGEQVEITNNGNGIIAVKALSTGKSVSIDLSK